MRLPAVRNGGTAVLTSIGKGGSAAASAVPLGALVDEIAVRTGAWVVVAQLGNVVAHGTGDTPCPGPLAAAVLSKSTAPLRDGVTWSRRSGSLRGLLDGVEVTAAELGDGVTAWFLAAAVGPADVEALRVAMSEEAIPVHYPMMADLLHPLGPSRAGQAPTALVLVLHATAPLGMLGRSALAAVSTHHGRVHTDRDAVVVALPPGSDPAQVLEAVRQRCPDAVAGAALVPQDARDWSSTARVAASCARAAATLGQPLARADEPAVAAELVVEEAQEAVRDLTATTRSPLHLLQEHDARGHGELVPTLAAWCRAGFDAAAAAGLLHVHTNTLRYRLRRASEISGLDLERPRHRLALQLPL